MFTTIKEIRRKKKRLTKVLRQKRHQSLKMIKIEELSEQRSKCSSFFFVSKLGLFHSFAMCLDVICKAVMKTRLSAGPRLWSHSTSGQESQNKSSAIAVKTWEVVWTQEWCDLTKQASKMNFLRVHFDRQRPSLPRATARRLFTLHSPFDTRRAHEKTAKLHTQSSRF